MGNKSVCILSESLYPTINAASLRMHYIVTAIKTLPLDITVLTATNKPLELNGIKIHALGYLSSRKSNSFFLRLLGEIYFSFRAAYYCLRSKFDIYYISSPSFISALLCGLLLKVFNRKYILEIRDLYPEVYRDAGLLSSNFFLYKTLLFFASIMYKNAFQIVTVTYALGEYLSGFNSKVSIVPNGFPAEMLLHVKNDDSKHQKFTVCIHGNFGVFQNINNLVSLIKISDKHKVDFKIIGYGKDFDKITDGLNGISNVIIYKTLSRDSLYEEISRCHVGLSMRDESFSSQVAFPVRIWEFIGLGLPVISAPANIEGSVFVKNNNIGSAVSLNKHEILSEIEKYIFDPKLLSKKIENLKNISCKFTREKIVSDLILPLFKNL
jgi:glycosyltransferase involved in cell wall biosynthesis